MVGLAIGVVRMGLEWSEAPPACGSGLPNEQLSIVTQVHYLHFAIILAVCYVIVAVTVSLFTQPRSKQEVNSASLKLLQNSLILTYCNLIKRIS